jgi:hypothetical protein
VRGNGDNPARRQTLPRSRHDGSGSIHSYPMNAPLPLSQAIPQAMAPGMPEAAAAAAEGVRLREIPYNYTSFSDREIVIRLLGPGPGSC